MSRTDAHRPWWVKQAQSKNWDLEMAVTQQCGCRMCTNYYGRKRAHSVARAREATLLSELSKTSTKDLENVDTYISTKDIW